VLTTRVTHRAARLPLDKSAGGGTVDNPASPISRHRDRNFAGGGTVDNPASLSISRQRDRGFADA